MLALSLEPQVQQAIVTTVGVVLVALIGAGVELLRRQNKRLSRVEDNTEAAVAQVENSHETNLRDDLDRVIEGLRRVLEGQARHDAALDRQGQDIVGLRAEIRHERAERLDVERRLDTHLADR